MKILAIRTLNLASLEGENEIDFTKEPLASAGVFALTGPTGSGKSTLLDALCLALYNETPRYKKVSSGLKVIGEDSSGLAQNNNKAILRNGSVEAYAEVDFLGIDQKQYRSRLRIWRASKKLDGNIKHEMVLTDIEKDEVIASKLTQVLAKIVELTGLQYQQFTRSVLLAQGDFTAFLKAPKDEQASLLEKLTGTEIYTEISKKVQEHNRAEQLKLEQLEQHTKMVVVMSEEEVLDLTFELEKNGLHLAKLQSELDKLKEEKLGLEAILVSTESYKQAQLILENAISSKVQNAEREKQLYKIRLVQEFKPIAKETVLLKAKIENTGLSLIQARQELEREKLKLEESKENEKNLKISEENAEQVLKNSQPIFQRARRIDEQIELLSPIVISLKETVNEGNKKLTEKKLESKKLEEEIALIKKEEERLKSWKENNETRKPIAENKEIIVSKLNDAERIWKVIEAKNKEITTLTQEKETAKNTEEKELELLEIQQNSLKLVEAKLTLAAKDFKKEKLKELRAQKSNALAQLQTLKNASHAWNKLTELKSQEEAILSEIKNDEDQIENAKKNLLSTTDEVTKSGSKLEWAEESYNQMKLAASKEVANLRSELRPQKPCLVCGSMEHPYSTSEPIANAILAEVESQLSTAKLAHQTAQKEQITLQQQVQFLKPRLENSIKFITVLQAKTEIAKNDWKPFADLTCIQNSEDSYYSKTLEKALIEGEEMLINLENELKTEENLVEQIEQLNLEFATNKEALQQAKNKLEKTKNTLFNLQQVIGRELASQEAYQFDLNQIEQVLSGYFQNKENWFTSWKNDPKAFTDKIELFANEWKITASNLDEILTKKVNLEIHTLQSKLNLIASEENVSKAKKEYELKTVEFKQKYESRNQIFDGESIEKVEAILQNAVEAEKEKLQNLQTNLNLQINEMVRLESEVKHTNHALEELQKQALDLQVSLELGLQNHNTNHQNIPISDLAELQSLLSFGTSWINKEEDDLNQIEEAIKKAKNVLEERFSSLEQLKKNQHSKYSIEEIIELGSQKDEETRKSQELLVEYKSRLIEHHKNLKNIGELKDKIQSQSIISENWAKLNELIGHSEGKKFSIMAQEYTLDVLVQHANYHLENLNKRYLLQRIPNSLGLQIVDQVMGDEIRSVHSLSGGESFLTSLALALGLASLTADRVKVESLFIDEGFGTLDAQTLQIAMDALDRLQDVGRKVGVVSHVTEMTERIPVKINVIKQYQGKSIISIEG